MSVNRHFSRFLLPLIITVTSVGCKDTSGPAIAVTLMLYSIDAQVVPVQLKTPGGKTVTIARGFLQGTNWGAACGFAVGLAEGPLTSVGVADCRLQPREERIFQITLTDSRFPAGTHTYRFIPVE